MNWHLLRYFTDRKQPVNYTRSREYHKNDNAHIEGKNWTHIRQYLGYGRFDNPALVALLNDLYTTEWRTFHNFFLPSMKLVRKERIGAKIMKHYDHAQTLCRRLLASPYISKKTKNELQRLEQQCNPYLLQRAIAKNRRPLNTCDTGNGRAKEAVKSRGRNFLMVFTIHFTSIFLPSTVTFYFEATRVKPLKNRVCYISFFSINVCLTFIK